MPTQSYQGITFIELLFVLIIVGILLSLASPSLLASLDKSRLNQARTQLMAAISLSRSEAIKRSYPVTLCSSEDQASCSDSQQWESGWIIVASTDANGDPIATNDSKALLHAQTALKQLRLLGNQTRITFQSDGTTNQAATWQFCQNRDQYLTPEHNTYQLNLAGRIKQTAALVLCP